MAGTMQEHFTPSQTFEQFSKLTSSDEAQAKLTAYPALVTARARQALQMLKEQQIDPQQLLEIIEPIAEVIGWAEGQAYTTNQQGPRSVATHVVAGGNGNRR